MRLGKFIFLFLVLTSCDYLLDQKVVVLDKETKTPVQSADVKVGPYQLTSDSEGFCHFRRTTGNLNKRTVEVSKSGYKAFSINMEIKDGYALYRQKIDSTRTPENSFAVMVDTLVVYMEKKEGIINPR